MATDPGRTGLSCKGSRISGKLDFQEPTKLAGGRRRDYWRRDYDHADSVVMARITRLRSPSLVRLKGEDNCARAD